MVLFASLQKLFLNLAPLTLLAVVLVSSFRMVHSDSRDSSGAGPVDRTDQSSVSAPLVPTPVAPQAVVVEAKSSVATRTTPVPVASEETPIEDSVVQELGAAPVIVPLKKEQVWGEINDAIYGLNELVGDELFLAVNRKEKGQMEVRLNDGLWKRVRYQTRVDLKTDISNLWHLYVKEYGHAGRSVVYFLDDSNDRVIDIFSKAK